MSATQAKKVKMATKSCPDCDQQVGGGPGAQGGRPLPAPLAAERPPRRGPGPRAGPRRGLGGRGGSGPDRAGATAGGGRPRRGARVSCGRAARKGAWACPRVAGPAAVTAAGVCGQRPVRPRRQHPACGTRAPAPGAESPAARGGFVPTGRARGTPNCPHCPPWRASECDKRGLSIMTFSFKFQEIGDLNILLNNFPISNNY